MKTLLKNVTLLPEYGFGSEKLHVQIEDRRIRSITKELPADLSSATVVECNGNLLIPAFYNTHCSNVFFDRFIKAIIFLENSTEGRHSLLGNN